MATTKLMTAEEFAALADDGTDQELVRGEVRTSPPPAPHHGEVQGEAFALIREHVRSHALGRVYTNAGFIIARDPDMVRAPDVCFVATNRLPPGPSPDRYPDLAPDFLIEVVSPSDRAVDVAEKMADWMAAGVRLAWVLYPKRRAAAVHLPGGEVRMVGPDGILDGGDVLPGFSCLVGDLFPLG